MISGRWTAQLECLNMDIGKQEAICLRSASWVYLTNPPMADNIVPVGFNHRWVVAARRID